MRRESAHVQELFNFYPREPIYFKSSQYNMKIFKINI